MSENNVAFAHLAKEIVNITTNNSTVSPVDNAEYVLNINQVSSISLSDGTFVTQRIYFLNQNSNNCTISFKGKNGTSTQTVTSGQRFGLIWNGTYYILDSSTPESSESLENKTIDYGNVTGGNILKCTPTIYTSSPSNPLNFTKEEHLVLSEGVTITLWTAPYVGYELRVDGDLAWNRNAFILFDNGTGINCVAISYEQSLLFTYRGVAQWVLQSGTTLRTMDWAVENAPIKDSTLDPLNPGYRYLPNSWNDGGEYGNGIGQWNFMYNSSYDISRYGLPVQRCSVSVMENHGTDAVAVCREIAYNGSGGGKTWIKERYNNLTWQNNWILYSADSENATLTNKTIDCASNSITTTANKAVVSDSSGHIGASSVTDTELGYVSGVTSSIQTQLNDRVLDTGDTITGTLILSKTQDASGTADNKPALIVGGTSTQQHIEMDGNEIMSKSNGTTTAQLYINDDGGVVSVGPDGLLVKSLTASKVVCSDGDKKLSSSSVTPNELAQLSGISTSQTVQTQLNEKQATITGAATSITGSDLTANRALVSNSSGKVAVSSVTDTELEYVSGVTSGIQTQINTKANDNAVVHIAGDGTTPEEVTGIKDFSYGHSGAQDDNNPSVRAARLRITGQVAPSTSQKSVSQVDFYIGNDNVAYMGCTRQNNATYVKVASNNDSVPLIFGYKPYQDNTACIRFEKNKPVWRGGQTGTYSADKDLAVVGDIKTGSYTLENKTIACGSNNITTTASRAIVSDSSGNIGASSVTSTELDYLSGVTSSVQTQITTITDKIPSEATSSNKLADKAYVTTAIQTNSANFRGNWSTWSNVPTSANDYPADAYGNKTPTVNDYITIQDASGYTGQTLTGDWRFKYTGTWSTDGKNGWLPEYQVMEAPISQAQQAALDSGITSTKVTNYDNHLSNTTIHVTSTDKSNWNGKVTANAAITGSQKCKITYDSKGLVTAGTDLIASDIPELATSKVTALTGYTIASSAAAIAATDSLNTALGKLQKSIDGKQSPISAGTAIDITSNTVSAKTMVASGSTAAAGIVPAPSTTAGTTKYLCENATWAVPPGTYTHPTSAGNKHIPSGGSNLQFLRYGGSSGTAAWATPIKMTVTWADDGTTTDYYVMPAT